MYLNMYPISAKVYDKVYDRYMFQKHIPSQKAFVQRHFQPIRYMMAFIHSRDFCILSAEVNLTKGPSLLCYYNHEVPSNQTAT